MRIALYGDHGFYTSGGQAGRRGDFITAPEVGPLFGTVLARWIEAEWHLMGEPDDFAIVECGAGPGTLARSVLAAGPQWRGRYYAVELAERQRREHPDGVVSTTALPPGPLDAVVIANELLDNVPFRLAVFDGGWREVAVAAARSGGFVEIAIEPDPAWDWFPVSVPHGTRLPVQDQAADWVSSARDLLRQGSVIAFDYCTTTTAELVGRPWREWLRTYRAQARGEHYLADPGAQDITAQVCIDQLPAATLVQSQAQFLRQWGIDELVEEGRLTWASSAARPDVRALSMRSRVRESEALVDLNGLGAFRALVWRGAA
jgi:SAM-dependent MidA family methyltransferase